MIKDVGLVVVNLLKGDYRENVLMKSDVVETKILLRERLKYL